MIDEPAAPAGKRPRSREQLLRVLHDDPRSVSRAEIKAAFADGRLGDQDLDIPVLAGMKRITELLAELDPNAAAPPPSDPETGAVAGALSVSTDAREASRASATSVRVQDIEEHLGRIADRLAALEAKVQEDRASAAARAAADDQMGQATARTVRMIAIALAIVAIVVVLQFGFRLANG